MDTLSIHHNNYLTYDIKSSFSDNAPKNVVELEIKKKNINSEKTKNIPGNEQQDHLLNEGFDYNNNVYASQCYYPNTFSSLSSPECEKFEGYKAPNQCAPLQAPIYKHEISEDTKQAYEDAINIALDDTNQPITRNSDDTILPYDENDMDLYFDTPKEFF